MLSVEQEVEGDDTLVIDSVLACDLKRANLLTEEKDLQSKLNKYFFNNKYITRKTKFKN